MYQRLQPHALEAATPCTRGCNPKHWRLQPHVPEAATPWHAVPPLIWITYACLYLYRQRELLWQLPPALVVCFNCLFPVNLALQMLWFVKIAKGLLGVLSRCHADGLRDRELLVARRRGALTQP